MIKQDLFQGCKMAQHLKIHQHYPPHPQKEGQIHMIISIAIEKAFDKI